MGAGSSDGQKRYHQKQIETTSVQGSEAKRFLSRLPVYVPLTDSFLTLRSPLKDKNIFGTGTEKMAM